MPNSSPINWRNRIVKYTMEAPEQLLAHPFNMRIHPKSQQDALEGVLDTIGIIAPILVNSNTQHVIDGHLRIQMAISKGQADIPVVYVDLDENEEAIALASYDFISSLAVYDKDNLNAILDEISTDNTAVQSLLSELAEREGVIPPTFDPVSIEEQPRLDEKAKCTCPNCGHEFVP